MKRSFLFGTFALLISMTVLGCGKLAMVPSGGLVGQSLTAEQRFSLMNTDGKLVELSQVLAQNKLVLINFWATWCSYCVEEMPELVRLQQEHGTEGFTVLAVNAGESAEQAAAFAKKAGLNFPVVLDMDTEVAQKFGLVGLPSTFLVDSTGKVLAEYQGFSPKLVADVKKALSV